MKATTKQRLVMLAGVVGLAGLSLMCRPDSPSEPEARGRPALSAAQVATVATRSQLLHGRADVAWVGDLHTRAMQEWVGQHVELSRLSETERCRRLVGLVRSYVPEVKRRTGISDDVVFDQAIAAARAQVGCDGDGGSLSIFALPARTFALPSLAESDTIVSGAYETYVPLLETALTSATSPDAAVASIDRVLAQASSLAPADFQVLAAMASLAASSAWYWYQYTGSGGSGGGGGGPAMSIFRLQAECTWQEFAKADFKGAVGVAGTLRLLGARDPRYLIAGFLGGGVIASGYFLYQCIEQET